MSEYVPIFQPGERTGVLLKGATLAACAAAEALDVDFAWLRRNLARRTKIAVLSFYPAAPDDPEVPSTPDWCDAARSAGFRVVVPPEPWSRKFGRSEWAKRQIAEAAVEMFVLSQSTDHIILIAGDPALTPLVRLVQRDGVRVTVISSVRNRPRLIADELRRQADQFVELNDMRDVFAKGTD